MDTPPPSPGQFSWTDPVTAAWSGDIDLVAVRSLGGFRTALMDPPQVLDLSGVTWFGSAAVGLLLDLVARARARGHRITVRGAPVTVTRRLVMVGADHLLDWD